MTIHPSFKFKYVYGLGDFVACILHRRPVSWITNLITKKNAPCAACSNRRTALNVLVKFQIWKFWFKTEKELLESLAAEYRSMGYKVAIDEARNKLSLSKAEIS